jgi:hypothetical protein
MGGNFAPELKRLLRDAGCRYERAGKGDHEIWFSPHTGIRFPVDQKNQVASYGKRRPEAGRPLQALLTSQSLRQARLGHDSLCMAPSSPQACGFRPDSGLVQAAMTDLPQQRLQRRRNRLPVAVR